MQGLYLKSTYDIISGCMPIILCNLAILWSIKRTLYRTTALYTTFLQAFQFDFYYL